MLQRCLDMTEAIAAMRVAFSTLYTGDAQVPQRLMADLAEQGVVLLMPSLLQTTEQCAFGLKVITVMRQKPLRGMPRSYASVLLENPRIHLTACNLRTFLVCLYVAGSL